MFGVSFLSPLFLLGLAAAAIPILIHLFHRRVEPVVEFGAMRFLRRTPAEQSRRRRLRELLLLALRAAALALLALAFARPYVTQAVGALSPPATVVLIDRSVSMSGPGQFERARTRAAEILRSAAAGSAVAVVGFAESAEVVAPLGDDRRGALTALAALRVGAGTTRYRSALTRAAELVGGRPARFVVLTDLQQNGWEAADRGRIPANVVVAVEDVGAPASNLAVTGLRVDGGEVSAAVQNYSNAAQTTQVSVALDGRPVNVAALSIAAGSSAEAHVTLPANATGVLTASVADAAGFAADNVRYAVVDADSAPLVLAVTASGHPSESLYLERALAVATGPDGFRFRAVSGPAFSGQTMQDLADVRAIAVLGTRGIEQHGRELLAGYVRGGGGLLITAGPDVEPAIMRQALQQVAQTTWRPRDAVALHFAPDDARHPIFRVFGGVGTLSNVAFSRASRIEPGDEARVVARYSDGSAAMVEEAAGDGRIILFGSDLNNAWNDFPLQPVFVPFVHETFRHLTAARQAQTDFLVGDLAGAGGRTPGVVAVGGRRAAVNTDPRESDPARITVEAFQQRVAEFQEQSGGASGPPPAQREDGQRLWQYALVLMIVGLVAEGALGRRLG